MLEVAFGADLVAPQYRRLVARDGQRLLISTTCPAIIGYVERYYPDLVADAGADRLADGGHGARCCAALHGDDLKVVFIGPCIAKKGETAASWRARSTPC